MHGNPLPPAAHSYPQWPFSGSWSPLLTLGVCWNSCLIIRDCMGAASMGEPRAGPGRLPPLVHQPRAQPSANSSFSTPLPPGKGWGDGPCNWGLRGLSLGASEGCWWGRGQGLLILLGLGVKPDAQVFYQGQETTAFYFNSSFLERSERVRERQIFHPLVHNADGGCDGWRRTSSKLEPSSGSPVSGQGLSSTAFPGT